MKKALIGAGVLMVLSSVLIFKGLKGLEQYNKHLEDLATSELVKTMKKQNQMIEDLQWEINDYNKRLDEQIKETERLVSLLKEYEVDPTKMDIQIDTI